MTRLTSPRGKSRFDLASSPLNALASSSPPTTGARNLFGTAENGGNSASPQFFIEGGGALSPVVDARKANDLVLGAEGLELDLSAGKADTGVVKVNFKQLTGAG